MLEDEDLLGLQIGLRHPQDRLGYDRGRLRVWVKPAFLEGHVAQRGPVVRNEDVDAERVPGLDLPDEAHGIEEELARLIGHADQGVDRVGDADLGDDRGLLQNALVGDVPEELFFAVLLVAVLEPERDAIAADALEGGQALLVEVLEARLEPERNLELLVHLDERHNLRLRARHERVVVDVEELHLVAFDHRLHLAANGVHALAAKVVALLLLLGDDDLLGGVAEGAGVGAAAVGLNGKGLPDPRAEWAVEAPVVEQREIRHQVVDVDERAGSVLDNPPLRVARPRADDVRRPLAAAHGLAELDEEPLSLAVAHDLDRRVLYDDLGPHRREDAADDVPDLRVPGENVEELLGLGPRVLDDGRQDHGVGLEPLDGIAEVAVEVRLGLAEESLGVELAAVEELVGACDCQGFAEELDARHVGRAVEELDLVALLLEDGREQSHRVRGGEHHAQVGVRQHDAELVVCVHST